MSRDGKSVNAIDFKNISEKSVVLAPFNSSITQREFPVIVEGYELKPTEVLKFSDKVREKNRLYEFNFNGEVDNGIMIS